VPSAAYPADILTLRLKGRGQSEDEILPPKGECPARGGVSPLSNFFPLLNIMKIEYLK
jgi:hypothetical protein